MRYLTNNPEGFAMALEALSDKGEAEWDLRAVRGLDKGVRLASFDLKKIFFQKSPESTDSPSQETNSSRKNINHYRWIRGIFEKNN